MQTRPKNLSKSNTCRNVVSSCLWHATKSIDHRKRSVTAWVMFLEECITDFSLWTKLTTSQPNDHDKFR